MKEEREHVLDEGVDLCGEALGDVPWPKYLRTTAAFLPSTRALSSVLRERPLVNWRMWSLLRRVATRQLMYSEETV